MKSITLIGNGVAAISMALKLRERNPNLPITLISKESPYFFSRPALMYIFMGHMGFKETMPYEVEFWQEKKITRVQDEILNVDFSQKILKGRSKDYSYDTLVLATGSRPRMPDWPGVDAKGVQGMYHLQDLDLLEKNLTAARTVTITGGGLIGVELAEMLHSRGFHPKMIIREDLFWNSVLPDEEAKLVTKHLEGRGVEFLFQEEISEIETSSNRQIVGIKTKSGKEISTDFLGVTIGVMPNIEFLRGSGLAIEQGILIDARFQTDKDNVYAIGDCAQFSKAPQGRRAIEAIWYTAKMQGETLARQLSGEDIVYQPGIWFNSAKFFDLEYQTYGFFPAKPTEDEVRFFWQAPKVELSVHLRWEKSSGRILAFNFFGTRARHAICEKWIAEGFTIQEVVKHIGLVNFDPEFFKPYHPLFIQDFNNRFPQLKVSAESSKGLRSKLALAWLQPSTKKVTP